MLQSYSTTHDCSIQFNTGDALNGNYTVIDGNFSPGGNQCTIHIDANSGAYNSTGMAGDIVTVKKNNGGKVTATFNNISMEDAGSGNIQKASGTLIEQ